MPSEEYVCRNTVTALHETAAMLRIDCRASSEHVTDIFEADPSAMRLFTPDRCFSCTKSRYADTSSVSTTTLRESGLLGGGQDATEERPQLERQHAEIEEVIMFITGGWHPTMSDFDHRSFRSCWMLRNLGESI